MTAGRLGQLLLGLLLILVGALTLVPGVAVPPVIVALFYIITGVLIVVGFAGH